MQNREEMDIDQTMDVPDTPDRSATWKTKGGEDNEKKVNSSATDDFRNSNNLDKGVLNRLRGSGRGNSGRLYSHPGKELSICDETEHGSSSSVLKNAQLFRRMIADKTSKCDTKHSAQPQQAEHVTSNSYVNGGSNYLVDRTKLGRDSCGITEVLDSDVKMQDGTSDEMIDLISSKKIPSSSTYSANGRNTRRKMIPGNTKYDKGKAICSEVSSKSFDCKDENSIMDLTVLNKHTVVLERAHPVDASKDFVAKEMRRGSTAANRCLSLHNIANSPNASSNSCKGKAKTDHDTYNGAGAGAGAGLDCGKGFSLSSDSHPKTEHILSRSLYSIASPRSTGQKRLVRNGHISPYNIARAKQSSEIHGNSYTNGTEDDIKKVVSGGSSCLVDIVSPNSEDNHYGKVKEKGVMHYPYPSKEHDPKTLSSSSNPTKEANGIRDANGDASRSSEEICGWRSTRNRSKKIYSPLSDDVGRISRRNDGVGYFLDQHHENRTENRVNVGEGKNTIETTFPEVQEPVPFQHGPASCSVQESSSIAMSEMDRKSGRNRGTNKLLKRQKKHSSFGSNLGECSTWALDDSEVAFLGSSGEPSNARSTRSRNPHHRGILGPVIEIDDLSPEIRCRMVDDDSDVRARQVEADEILARQLQEQLYHEFPGAGGGEIDASIAWTLQQGEDAQHNSRGSHRASHPDNKKKMELGKADKRDGESGDRNGLIHAVQEEGLMDSHHQYLSMKCLQWSAMVVGILKIDIYQLLKITPQYLFLRDKTNEDESFVALVLEKPLAVCVRDDLDGGIGKNLVYWSFNPLWHASPELCAGQFLGIWKSCFPRGIMDLSELEGLVLENPGALNCGRIHMLEALEAAVGNSSDVTRASHFFQAQRDFNENDYEMLLTLDEDNHHGGASLNQINGLPQSTVQITLKKLVLSVLKPHPLEIQFAIFPAYINFTKR
ncbi:hypothetical protein HHK36_013011 [Tetracentron sinense]|uniref:Uncharacterized protein n=1 Tax=Tetracentron sinense TaxID=13715 RepID=A0A834Z6X2_TETSI|nr:hypothetical protein HHK36_013011 [Tetracentron sinense]